MQNITTCFYHAEKKINNSLWNFSGGKHTHPNASDLTPSNLDLIGLGWDPASSIFFKAPQVILIN